MTLKNIKSALGRTFDDVDDHHTLQMAAALSYYFVMSLFPSLVLLSAVLAFLPLPDLFHQPQGFLWRFIPARTVWV